MERTLLKELGERESEGGIPVESGKIRLGEISGSGIGYVP
jgi:hypothetical protein